jgi:hypothetical protein
MLELTVMLGLAGLLMGAAAMLHRASVEQARLNTALEAAIVRSDEDYERIRQLESELADARAAYKAGGLKYEECLAVANSRWIEAARQNANMAERLAGLKLTGEVEETDTEHIEAVPPPLLLSPELQTYIDGLNTSLVRDSAYEFIETRRRAGMEDEQIMQELEDSWTVS